MISLQKLFGKDDRFFNLLEASAEEARNSIQALNKILWAWVLTIPAAVAVALVWLGNKAGVIQFAVK